MTKREAIKLAKDFRLGNKFRKKNLMQKYNIKQATSPNTGRVKMGIRIDIENNPRDYRAAIDDDGGLIFFTGNPMKRVIAKDLWDTPKARKEDVNKVTYNREKIIIEKLLPGEDKSLLEQFSNSYNFDINKFSIIELKKSFAIFKNSKIEEATQYQLVAQKVDNGGEVRSKFYDDENSLADMQKAVEDSENYESSMVLKRIVGTDEKEGEELEQDIENEHTIHENFIKNLKAMPNEVRSQDKKSVSDLVSLIIKKAKPTEISKTFKKLTRAGKDYVMGVISTADKDPLLQKGKVLNTIVNEEFEITRLSKIDGRTKQFKEKLRSLEYRKQFELDELTLKKAKAVDPDTEVFVNFKKQNNKYPFAANNLKFSKGAGFIFHRPVTNRAKQLPIPGNFTTGAWVRIKDLPGLIVRDSAKATANARILKKFLNAIPGISIDEVSLATLGQQAKSGKAAAALFVLYFVAKGVEGLLDKGIYVKRIERGAQSDKKTVVALGNTPMRESTQIDEIAPIAVGAAKVIGGAIATAGAMKGGEAIVKKKERQERIKRWRGRLRHARMQLKAAKTESDKKIARERINNLQDRLDEID